MRFRKLITMILLILKRDNQRRVLTKMLNDGIMVRNLIDDERNDENLSTQKR